MIPQIRPAQFAAWIESVKGHGTPVILDVREPSELQKASIHPDAVDFVAIPMGIVPVRLAELNPGRPIACLCHYGARSMQIATFLSEHGFDLVVNIAGGINAWSTELDSSVPHY